MLKGTNLEYAKIYNVRIVLETIRLHGPISRASVARHTELTPQTISNLTAELLEQSLIVEAGRKQGRRGSPSTLLEFNAEGAFAVGLDLDQEHLTGVLVDLNGVVHGRFHTSLDFPSPDEALDLMASVAERLIGDGKLAADKVWGVGVGLPGPIRIADGHALEQVVNPDSFPGWVNVPVVDRLTKRLDLPVYLENNATAAAIGESFYGAGQGVATFVYVFLGLGLGGGIILNGQPLHGFRGNTGEFGFIPVRSENGETERVGHYFNLPSLYQQLGRVDVKVGTPGELEPLFLKQHPLLLEWLDTAARHLAPALVAGEFFLDPEAIIFGGSWPAPLIDYLIGRLETLLPDLRIAQKTYQSRLVHAEAGEDAAALGVATLPIYNSLAPHPKLLNKNSQSPLDQSLTLAGRR
ncbi:ROK family protein [soil metagenome]